MIEFCKIDEKIDFLGDPSQKVRTGAPIPIFFLLVHYDNTCIMKHPAKF